MPEENERNLRGDEALLALIIAGRWRKPGMITYCTRTMADPTVAVARLYAYLKNEGGSEAQA